MVVMSNEPSSSPGTSEVYDQFDAYGVSVNNLNTIASHARRILQISDIAITKRTASEQSELDGILDWWRENYTQTVQDLTNRPFHLLLGALESVEKYTEIIHETLTLSTVEVFPDNTSADFWSREQLAISISKIGVLQCRVSSLYTATYAQAALLRDLVNEAQDALDFANSDVRGTEKTKSGIGRAVGMADVELSNAIENAKAFIAMHSALLVLKNSLEHQFQLVSRILSALHEHQS